MTRARITLVLLAALGSPAVAPLAGLCDPDVAAAPAASADWPWWRGPTHDGRAPAGETPPLSWSETENIVWKAPIPGRGHGSPTVVGDVVVLATADEGREVQSVLCFDRATGARRWKTDVHTGGFAKLNRKASHASSTVAWDGERYIVNFLNGGAVSTTALDRGGKKLWQRKISDYVVHQGYGSSPFVYRSLVLVSADNKSGGAVAALRRTDGEVVWRVERPRLPNYPSPVVLTAAGREQLVLSGCERVSSFDPLTGETIWETPGATTECVTTSITDGERVFTSGGYPRNHVAAVRADGSGKVEWEHSVRVYVPSMLLADGVLYAVGDGGVAHCWKSDTGEQMWRERLGGEFTASPVLVGDRIYATNEDGKTFVFAAKPSAFERLGTNEIAGEVLATPAICGGRIYLRVARREDGGRQEMLYCIGEGSGNG